MTEEANQPSCLITFILIFCLLIFNNIMDGRIEEVNANDILDDEGSG